MNLCEHNGNQEARETIPARELREGDFVDMEETGKEFPFPFTYTDPLAEFEMGHVDSIEFETENCLVIDFDNLTTVAVSPEQMLVTCPGLKI